MLRPRSAIMQGTETDLSAESTSVVGENEKPPKGAFFVWRHRHPKGRGCGLVVA